MNHRPIANGLILCEQVIVDIKSRNVTPVNCFGARKLSGFPGVADFHIVAWLTDGLGEVSLEIVVRSLDSLDEVHRVEQRLQFTDRLKNMLFTARIRDCPFPVAGYYEVALLADGEYVANRKIRLHS